MKLLALLLFMFPGFQASPPSATPAPFHWHDDYTEYHLLEPASSSFHIVYYLNQRQAGLTYVLNQTRSGSAGSDISVTDPRTGEPLKFDYMTGKELAAAGVTGRLSPEEHYIRAHLPRPVPAGGEGRVRIEKTYADAQSYFTSAETITFARSLGIGRNAIILPAGYGLVSSNVAAEVATLGDGRIQLSFENINSYASDVSIRAARRAGAKRLPAGATSNAFRSTKTLYEIGADGLVAVRHERVHWTSPERFGPDATLTTVGLEQFGSLRNVRVTDLDTGEPMAVVPPAGRGQFPSARLTPMPGTPILSANIRIEGTLREPADIRPVGLTWSRVLFEPRATIVLPAGYEVTYVNVPVTTGTLPDGRMYLQVVNNRVASTVRLEIRAGKIE
ncbi:MAG: hypothetical protein WD690_04585 [Vicinamibacterales bacterium]